MHSRHPAVLALLPLTLLAIANAQSTPLPWPSPPPSPTPSPLAHTVGRTFSVSTTQPFRQILRRVDDYLQGQRAMQSYIEAVERLVLLSIRTQRRTNPSRADDHDVAHIQPCDLVYNRFRNAVKFRMELRGLPLPDLSCLTEYIGGVPNVSARHVFRGMMRRGDAISRNRFRMADVAVGNWTKGTDNPYVYNFSVPSISCRLVHGGGMRVFDKWYLNTAVTNQMGSRNLPMFQRQYLVEYHHLLPDGQLDDALHFSSYVRPPDGDPSPHRIEPNTTTILGSTGGPSKPSYFGEIQFEDIPAIRAAVDKMQLHVQQADDALAASSIAILTLPLVLNLVPSYLVTAYSSSRFLLIYTLMTDVVTVVPLAIKGVELVLIGRWRTYVAAMRMSSSINGSMSDTAGAQIWAAKCFATRDLITVGVVFLGVSIAMMVVGIVLEVALRSFIVRRLKLGNTAAGWSNQLNGLSDDGAALSMSTSLNLSPSVSVSVSPSVSQNHSSVHTAPGSSDLPSTGDSIADGQPKQQQKQKLSAVMKRKWAQHTSQFDNDGIEGDFEVLSPGVSPRSGSGGRDSPT